MFQGVASTYLATRVPGSRVRCFVRRSQTGFHLPHDGSVPIIMVAAGTGLAPMRGFVQQRACIAAAAQEQQQITTDTAPESASKPKLGPALLYFGCRDHASDYLYAEELHSWEKLGVVQVRPAFSRRGPDGGEGGQTFHRYTHERMWAEREEIRDLFKRGAKIFVCGSASKLARSTNEVVKRIWKEGFPGKTDEEAQAWLDSIREVRYVTDVFD
ncbi:hypothetical protein F5Y17DRAFT_450227 [Xylariaceae sp. FL0594]|nr:hypothetical protein F5Y17DRAFT_450227 [Xylariaceae sp. FL0594]